MGADDRSDQTEERNAPDEEVPFSLIRRTLREVELKLNVLGRALQELQSQFLLLRETDRQTRRRRRGW